MPRLSSLYCFICIFSAIFLISSCKDDDTGGPDTPIDNYKSVKHVATGELSKRRRLLTAVAVGDKVLFAGGLTSIYYPVPGGGEVTYTHYNRVDIYDTKSGTWSIDSISIPRSRIGSVSAGMKAYFAGGTLSRDTPYTKRIDVYDAETKSWRIDSLSEGKREVTTAVLDNKVFFIGGVDARQSDARSVDIYNTQTKTWDHTSTSIPLKGDRALSGNELFFVREDSDTVDVYNLINNSIRVIKLSARRSWPAVAASGHVVVFAGGRLPSGIYTDLVDIYDTQTGTWSVDSLSLPRNYSAGVAAGNLILFAGGETTGFHATNRIDIYNVNTRKWSIDSLTFYNVHPLCAIAGNKVIIASSSDESTRVDTYELEK